LGAPIVDANQMSGQPLVLALALGIAVLVFLSAAVVSSARRRRRELAVLLALGMTHRQLRSIIAWQTSTLLVVAVALGTPLGIIAGKWTWENFATSLGVVPTSVVPVELLIVGAVVLVGVGALLMLLPRFFSRASTPASWLRREE
jgi:ABC-type antimicrobial peptide transport system permease subunit